MNASAGSSILERLGQKTRTRFFTTDVSDSSSIASAVRGTLEWIGETGKELGGVIAAAGVSTPAKIINRNGEGFDMAGFDFVMGVNVRGSVDLCRQFLPRLTTVKPEGEDGERGVLVLVSSSAA